MDKSKDNIDLRIENELKKKELEKKFGPGFNHVSNLSPELEKEWLKSIEQFEEQYRTQGTTSVWEYIYKPPFKKPTEIKTIEIPGELNRLKDIMGKHGIKLDTLSEVAVHELYRFVTEELFNYEIDDIRLEGLSTVFIYEEFHPNAELDIKHAYNHLLNNTFGKLKQPESDCYDMSFIDLDGLKDSNGNGIEKKTAINSICNFLDSFDYFEIKKNNITELTIDKDNGHSVLNAEIDLQGCFNDSSEVMDFSGPAHFKLKPGKYDWWFFYHINMPGLKITPKPSP